MKLEEDWRDAWKWLSVQLSLVLAAAHEIYEQMQSAKDYIEPSTFNHIMAALTVLVIIARIKKQAP